MQEMAIPALRGQHQKNHHGPLLGLTLILLNLLRNGAPWRGQIGGRPVSWPFCFLAHTRSCAPFARARSIPLPMLIPVVELAASGWPHVGLFKGWPTPSSYSSWMSHFQTGWDTTLIDTF